MADPVFLITGASSGIGAATARHAARDGLPARAGRTLGGQARRRSPRSSDGLAVRCDVTEWEDQQRMVAAALDAVRAARRRVRQRRLRRAARLPRVHPRALARDGADERVRRGAHDPRHACPPLRESRGHVLLTGSVAGRRALPGSLYSCTKWAVTAMGEALRQEVDGSGVRVTLIEPGMVDTPFFDNRPQGALEADDIARAVMFAVRAAPARGRERDPGAAHGPERLASRARTTAERRTGTQAARPSRRCVPHATKGCS